MRQTESGRWVPDKPQKPGPDELTETGHAQAQCRRALAAGIEMPWWYPIMSFEAAVGRSVLR